MKANQLYVAGGGTLAGGLKRIKAPTLLITQSDDLVFHPDGVRQTLDGLKAGGAAVEHVTLAGNRNQVEFNGEVTSLSDAAIQAYKTLGQEVQALSGPWEWTHEGRRLDEIRREIEEKSD